MTTGENNMQRRNQTNTGSHNKPSQRRKPAAFFIAIDVLAAAALLGVFYITNYMIPVEELPEDLPTPSALPTVSAEPATSSPQATATIGGETAATTMTTEPTPTPTIDPNDWRAKFADKFTGGEVIKTDSSYQSANVSITIQAIKKFDATCYVADIYVADLKYFKNAFGKKADVMGGREYADKVANANGAILAINGDHCVDNVGPVIRNGKSYRDQKTSADILVMNYDGSMEAFSPEQYDSNKIRAEGAWQVWTFGPMLLQGGQPMTKFNSNVVGKNPRTAVGYYEPGHYCFVVVGGRQKGYSEGVTMTQLSQLMQELGCSVAYNMDGGRSSEMIFQGKMLNHQDAGRRTTTEILYVGDN